MSKFTVQTISEYALSLCMMLVIIVLYVFIHPRVQLAFFPDVRAKRADELITWLRSNPDTAPNLWWQFSEWWDGVPMQYNPQYLQPQSILQFQELSGYMELYKRESTYQSLSHKLMTDKMARISTEQDLAGKQIYKDKQTQLSFDQEENKLWVRGVYPLSAFKQGHGSIEMDEAKVAKVADYWVVEGYFVMPEGWTPPDPAQ